ncbi:hypothetical protein ACLB2K_074474 [Fragaria x ananassa]
MVGDAAGVFWGGGALSPVPEGGEQTNVRTLSRVQMSTSHPACIYMYSPFRPYSAARGRASTPTDSSSFPDHFPSPASPPNSSFPARSPKTSNKINLAGKLEFGGLTGDGKWWGKLLESAGVEARPRRRRTVANG